MASTSTITHSLQSSESGSSSRSVHPFENARGLLIRIPDRIDVEEESQFYDDIVDSAATRSDSPDDRPDSPPFSAHEGQSIFSNDIWLGDNCGESKAFAQSVQLSGWSKVGDRKGGAYIVYDCVVRTKEGTVVHALKRYSAFAQLSAHLRATLPANQLPFIPALPPKSPLAKFGPRFLDRRRRLLEHWLSAVLLHPEIGGCQAVREWVVNRV